MNLKLVLSAVITLILTVQSGADHLSGLNIEGRYASVIQAEHQRWLDGQNPDSEFQHHQDFVDMFVALNNCSVTESRLRECYELVISHSDNGVWNGVPKLQLGPETGLQKCTRV